MDQQNTCGLIGDLVGLKKRHTFLNEYSDEMLKNTSLETLLKLESTSIKLKNLENSKAAEDKLSYNRDNLVSTPTVVPSGQDNRWSVIHAARFLPGLGCSTSKMWTRAREVMGGLGHIPIATYDMHSIGLAGHVTPQGWSALHDPGNASLSLRMFSINNCGRKVQMKAGDILDDNLVDVIDLGEFKSALRVLREAMHFVHPWNWSVSTIEGFLIQTNFCSQDLTGVEKKGQLLTQFVDYCLRENSNKWKGQETFLSLGDLKSTWESFFGSRPQAVVQKSRPNNNNNKYTPQQPKQQYNQQGQATYTNRVFVPPALFNEDICCMWNIGKCTKQAGTCQTRAGKMLRHVCNHRPDPTNPSRYCGAQHAACYYH